MAYTVAMIFDVAKDLAHQFAMRADEADKCGKLPAEDVQALKDSGFLALNVPQAYGGSDLTMRDCLNVALELSQGSSSTALVLGMQLQIFGQARESCPWSEEVYEQFCRAAVKGGIFNSVATEPDLGSPSRGAFFASTATRTDEGFMINGHKTWTTGGRFLTHLLVSVSLEDEPVVLLVESDRPGIEWVETWGHGLSLRASDSHDVVFKNVFVPHKNLIASRKSGGRRPNPWFPLILAAIYLGAAFGARNTVIQYALERVPTALGKTIATLPKIQRQIGEIDMVLQAARALLLEVADEWDGGVSTGYDNYPRVAAAKHFAVEVANDVTDKALGIAGGAALTEHLPLERYFRDVRAGSMQPPSGDTALEIIGRGAIEEKGALS